MISGCLEIIDILLFGTADEAEQVIATSGLDNEQLGALARALVDLTINLRSQANFDHLLFDIIPQHCQGLDVGKILNIGGIIVEHNVLFPKIIPIEGREKFSISIKGGVLSDLPRRFASGELIVHSIEGQGWAISTEFLEYLHGGLYKSQGFEGALSFATPATNDSILGQLLFSVPLSGKATPIEDAFAPQGIIPIPFWFEGDLTKTRLLQSVYATFKDDVTSFLALPNLRSSYGIKGISTVPMKISGWVTSEIVKLLSGYLPFSTELTGHGKIATDELMFVSREFIKGDVIIQSIPRVHDSTPSFGEIEIELLLRGASIAGKSKPLTREFIIKDILPKAILRHRSGDELMALTRELNIITFWADALASYQQRKDMWGTLRIIDWFNAEAKGEEHLTMTYEIVPDEEFGGDTYYITTKYHKEVDGIVSIGWRYFKYLIE